MNRTTLGYTDKTYSKGLLVSSINSFVFISGQIARDNNNKVMYPNDLRQQARYIFENINKLINEAKGEMKNIVKLVAYVTTLDGYDEYAELRREFFGDFLPTSSTVQVAALVVPGCVIEIEAVGIL